MPWGPAPTTKLVVPSDATDADARIELVGSTDVPSEITSFYSPTFTVRSAFVFYFGDGTYWYNADLGIDGTNTRAVGWGMFRAGAIAEYQRVAYSTVDGDSVAIREPTNFNDLVTFTKLALFSSIGSGVQIGANASLTLDGTFTVDGIHGHRSRDSGSQSLSFGPAASFTQAISFSGTFSRAPEVMTNIASGSGSTAGWISRAINITTTGFTLFVSGPSSTWTGHSVQWQAST